MEEGNKYQEASEIPEAEREVVVSDYFTGPWTSEAFALAAETLNAQGDYTYKDEEAAGIEWHEDYNADMRLLAYACGDTACKLIADTEYVIAYESVESTPGGYYAVVTVVSKRLKKIVACEEV